MAQVAKFFILKKMFIADRSVSACAGLCSGSASAACVRYARMTRL